VALQEGAGQEIAIPRGSKLRPVEAAQAWLTAGPIFRPINKADHVVKDRAPAVGTGPRRHCAGHSLRAGFLTSAAETGATVVQDDGGQPPQILRGYVRRADMFKDHAGGSFP
jgi:hypothetical protein